MKSMHSRKIIKLVKQHGWVKIRSRSSHVVFKHPEKMENLCVVHPCKHVSPNVMKNVERITGIDLDQS